jgi:hypothetical protein
MESCLHDFVNVLDEVLSSSGSVRVRPAKDTAVKASVIPHVLERIVRMIPSPKDWFPAAIIL